MIPPRSASDASPSRGRTQWPGKAGSTGALTWNPVTLVRRRFQAWWQARLPLSDTTTLTQRNVYILPTRPGFTLGATLLVLLVASINYQLNLGYLLTFLLAGSAVVGMHVCHGTLRGLTMNLIAPDAQFAGASAIFGINLVSEKRSIRHGIGLSVLGAPGGLGEQGSGQELSGEKHWVWADVPAQGSCTVHVAFKPERRGLHPLPTLTAETRFPLGTFRVWTVWRPAAQVLVYPAPEPYPPPLPPGEPRSGGAAAAQLHATGEYDGVRAYRRGDPLKLVVWKKAAKADELVSRDAQQVQRFELWLDFAHTGTSNTELKLSRLCAWVLEAHKRGTDYGLRLPGVEIKPACDERHKKRCLEALALC
jgi:uncharacterized protein (DUF58 family)